MQTPANQRTLSSLRRRQFLVWAVAAGGSGLVAACGPSAPPPQAPAAAPTPAAAAPTPAAAAPTPAAAKPTAPSVAGTPTSATTPQTAPAQATASPAWNQVLDAATKEAKVVVSGPPTDDARKNLPDAFKKRFGIDLEYLGGNSSQLASRIESERAAGQYTIDVSLGGADTFYRSFLGNDWLDPIKPILMLPEVVDPKAWSRPDGIWFRDPQRQDTILELFNTITPIGYFNTSIISPDQLQTADQLLDPKLKGQIGAYNPTVNGGGVLAVSGMYVDKGPDFVKNLFATQNIALTRDYQQLADWVGHGNYPLCMGMLVHDAEALKADLPVQQTSFSDVQETVSGGFGMVGFWKNAPHPNAAKVFINWIATKEGSTIFGQADGSASLRTDVDSTAWVPANLIPKPDGKYLDSYEYKFVTETRATIQQVLAPLVGG